MDNSLLDVRDINHKYIVVDMKTTEIAAIVKERIQCTINSSL